MKEVLIALDQGSSSSRALAFDARGKAVARAQLPVRTFLPRPGWVEHDADDILRSQERALDQVLAKLGRRAGVLGIGLSCQRSTLVAWDAKTGRPLSRVLSWQDGRAGAVAEAFAARQQEVHSLTGLYMNPYYSAPKLRWLIDNEPAVRRAAERGTLRAGPVATFLLWRWTRGELFLVDPSLAQRMLLLNIRTFDWDPELLAMFGVAKEALPRLSPSAGRLGVIERGGRKIPVVALLGDQQAAALGLGAEEPGAGILNHGTGAFFLLNTGTELRSVPGLLTSVAWRGPEGPGRFFLEGTVHAAATSFTWLKEGLGLLRDVRDIDRACARSSRRLLALPAIGGLGAPRWDYSTFTAFLGMNSKTRPEDVVRGVTEGIAFLVADIVQAMRDAGLGVRSIRAAGGLSRTDALIQFESDLLQAPILRMKESEATAFGVAKLCAQQSGLGWDPALESGKSDRLFRPRIPAEEAGKLLAGWKLFVEAQQSLSADLRRLGVLG